MSLTKENKNAILTAIALDGFLCNGQLVNGSAPGCDHVGRCAMGTILFHHGISNSDLDQLPNDLSNLGADASAWSLTAPEQRAHAVLNRLGLTNDMIEQIISFNDGVEYPESLPLAEVWARRAQDVIHFIQEEL